MIKKVVQILPLLMLCTFSLNADVKHVTTTEELNKAMDGKKAVVKSYATWCHFCKQIADDFEKLSNDYPEIVFIEVEASTEAAKDWNKSNNVRGFPHTTMHDESGKKVAEVGGANVEGIKRETAKLSGKAMPAKEEKPAKKKEKKKSTKKSEAKKEETPKKKKMAAQKQKTEKKPRKAKKDDSVQKQGVGCKNEKCMTCTDNECMTCNKNECQTCGK